QRKVKNAVSHERAAVGDAHYCRSASLEIGHSSDGIQRQRLVSCGERVHIVNMTIGAAAIVIRGSIPAGDANFRVKNPRVRSRNLDLCRGLWILLGRFDRLLRGLGWCLLRGRWRKRRRSLHLFFLAAPGDQRDQQEPTAPEESTTHFDCASGSE